MNSFFSHPQKTLTNHTRGVLDGVRRITASPIAEVAAIFHDVGKMNPNFQMKLNGQRTNGYSHHAYFSAFSFLCWCAANQSEVLELFGGRKESIASALAIIAHHHGDLPDYPCILSENEKEKLQTFLKGDNAIPASEFVRQFIQHETFSISNHPHSDQLLTEFPIKLASTINDPVKYFLETRFMFASLINADKTDAGGYTDDKKAIKEFCQDYPQRLDSWLGHLQPDSELNRLRTQMRMEAKRKIQEFLPKGKRLFSLTAPTGSGKTFMLLSLAGEIIKNKGEHRIIYALPFLSITEQVESICKGIFGDEYIYRVDSKTDNLKFEEFQKRTDDDPDFQKEVLAEQFREDTFEYPFIITTFVKLFETLVSNRNATLLKLPNFSKCIFLIDEIQALPPRLYGFFTALLDSFCRLYDSYAVLSTATMPNFKLPQNNKHGLSDLFIGYEKPPELLSFEYFDNEIFNRYDVFPILQPIEISQLVEMVLKERGSTLVMVNTIEDSKEVFELLQNKDNKRTVMLLNTHFTPADRQEKIACCKSLIEKNEYVLLVSTQLIEAGVDIDFPIVYRDLCSISSIVQSAGRCNRNGKRDKKGKVVVYNLQKNNRSRAALIYRDIDSRFLSFTREQLHEKRYDEPDIFRIQKLYFEDIQSQTLFGYHKGNQFRDGEIDFIGRIKEAQFEEIGKFKLIDEKEFGEELRYYIPVNEQDDTFEILVRLWNELRNIPHNNFGLRKLKQIQIENHFKKMASRIVQIRIRKNDIKPIASGEPCCGIYKLDSDKYNNSTGVKLDSTNQFI